jgi:hypothetical protein
VNTAWLTRASKWIDEGGELVASGTRTIYKKNGDEIFEVKNGSLLGNQKQHYDLNRAGTPVGDPVGGYQVVKVGDDVKLRRAPDEAPYAGTSYQTRLNEHPNAHVLERHGHDVTDDALIKRANEGIAPDGSTIRQNPPYVLPPYSSKFSDPNKLKAGFDNTKPGSIAFQNAVPNGNRIEVTHVLSSGFYGKGVAKNQSTFTQMKSVTARYEDVGGGNWQLVTMYPNP